MTVSRKSLVLSALAGALVLSALMTTAFAEEELERRFVGSIQLDYLTVPTRDNPREIALDAATVELSMRLHVDYDEDLAASVKVCVACHGLEVGMAYFDMRLSEQFNLRVGRFTPAFGEFPLRHDPASHRTSDKPLPYDMGRMLRPREWNMSILPAPWVDNGVEFSGNHFFGESSQIDFAVYAVSGPRANVDAIDFDYIQSRTPAQYYIDNNSFPVFGGRFSATFGGEKFSGSAGASTMAGSYDPNNQLDFIIVGADLVLEYDRIFLRGEYLLRRTEFSLGEDPARRFKFGPNADGEYDDHFLKEGFYTELEVPLGPFDFVLRWDGMRRRGNVLATSALSSDSQILRYTGATAIKLKRGLKLKLSGEFYQFNDFEDDIVAHVGIAGPL